MFRIQSDAHDIEIFSNSKKITIGDERLNIEK